MKIHKKMKVGILEIGTFSAISYFQSTMNLKLKFWGYDEKNMGFHLTPKKYYFLLHPGGENVIGIIAFKHISSGCPMDNPKILRCNYTLKPKFIVCF